MTAPFPGLVGRLLQRQARASTPPASLDPHDRVFEEIRAGIEPPRPVAAASTNVDARARGAFRPTTRQQVTDIARQTGKGLSAVASGVLQTPAIALDLLGLASISADPRLRGIGALATVVRERTPAVAQLESAGDDIAAEAAAFYGRPTTQSGRTARFLSEAVASVVPIERAASLARALPSLGRGVTAVQHVERAARHLRRRAINSAALLHDALELGNLPPALYRAQLTRQGLYHGSRDLPALMTSIPGVTAPIVRADELGKAVVRTTPRLHTATGFNESSTVGVISRVRLTPEAAREVFRPSSIGHVREWQRFVNRELRASGMQPWSFRKHGGYYRASAARDAAGRAADYWAKRYPAVDARGLAPLEHSIDRLLSGQLYPTEHGTFTSSINERQLAIQRPEAISEIEATLLTSTGRRILPSDFAIGTKRLLPDIVETPIARTVYQGGEPVRVELLPIPKKVLNQRAFENPTRSGRQNAEAFILRLLGNLERRGFVPVRVGRKMVYERVPGAPIPSASYVGRRLESPATINQTALNAYERALLKDTFVGKKLKPGTFDDEGFYYPSIEERQAVNAPLAQAELDAALSLTPEEIAESGVYGKQQVAAKHIERLLNDIFRPGKGGSK